jgi:integrase
MPVYKDKNRKAYYVKFYYKDWQNQGHQKLKRGFATAKEAKEFERSFLNKIAENCCITFENLCKNYLEDSKVRLKITTYQNKEYIVRKWLIPFLGDKPIKEITPLVVRKWQNIILKKNYSPTYQRRLNAMLSAVFNYAVKYYALGTNPVRISGPIGRKNAEELNFWTLDDFKRFISGVDMKEENTFYVAFLVLFYSGIRVGELLALIASDFNYRDKTLSISKNFARIDGEDLILSPKTPKSKRTITIPDFLCDILKNYIEGLYSSDARLFFTLNKYSLGRKLKKIAHETGVKTIRIHDLRHSHASLLVELGFSPLLISERLGHERIETTLQIYSHLYPNKVDEVAKKLDALDK